MDYFLSFLFGYRFYYSSPPPSGEDEDDEKNGDTFDREGEGVGVGVGVGVEVGGLLSSGARSNNTAPTNWKEVADCFSVRTSKQKRVSIFSVDHMARAVQAATLSTFSAGCTPERQRSTTPGTPELGAAISPEHRRIKQKRGSLVPVELATDVHALVTGEFDCFVRSYRTYD